MVPTDPIISTEETEAGKGNYWTISLRGPNYAGSQLAVFERYENWKKVRETEPMSLGAVAQFISELQTDRTREVPSDPLAKQCGTCGASPGMPCITADFEGYASQVCPTRKVA